MEVLLAAAKHTFPFVSLPYLYFNVCWNQAIVRDIVMIVFCYVGSVIKNAKLELKPSSPAFVFKPCINQFEDTGISPNAHLNLVVHSNSSSRSLALFIGRDCFPKQSVLCEGSCY